MNEKEIKKMQEDPQEDEQTQQEQQPVVASVSYNVLPSIVVTKKQFLPGVGTIEEISVQSSAPSSLEAYQTIFDLLKRLGVKLKDVKLPKKNHYDKKT